jgi:hypothetical protein
MAAIINSLGHFMLIEPNLKGAEFPMGIRHRSGGPKVRSLAVFRWIWNQFLFFFVF